MKRQTLEEESLYFSSFNETFPYFFKKEAPHFHFTQGPTIMLLALTLWNHYIIYELPTSVLKSLLYFLAESNYKWHL